MPPNIHDDDVLLEVDGPGASPAEVDATALLELSAAFFRLILDNAADTGKRRRLALHGITIEDKCVAIRARANNAALAKHAAERAVRQIAGADEEGPRALVERARAAMRGLPSGQRAKIIVGPWSAPLAEPEPLPPAPADAIIAIRAKPIRAGGRRPAVRFSSPFEDEFTLQVSEEQARKLGAALYNDVEIEALVRRDRDGSIEEGTLISFETVADTDPRPEWRRWLTEVWDNGELQSD